MNYYLIVIPESQKIQTKREGGISIIIDLIFWIHLKGKMS